METATVVYWGNIGIMERNMETTTIVYWCSIGIMEKKMETTTIVYWGDIGILEKKMEITIMGFRASRLEGIQVLGLGGVQVVELVW